MGNECSSLTGASKPVPIKLPDEVIAQLKVEFDRVDPDQIGRISVQQFQKILAHRAYVARTGNPDSTKNIHQSKKLSEFQQKINRHSASQNVKDRELAEMDAHQAFDQADVSRRGYLDFDGFVQWQSTVMAQRKGSSWLDRND